MNWYKNITSINRIRKIKNNISSSSIEKIVKHAAANLYSDLKPIFTKDKSVPATNQTAQDFQMYDIQRYVFDSYAVKTSFSQTNERFAISIITNHAFLGTITWDEYWFYDLTEFDKAYDTYKKLNKIVEEITTQFVEAGGGLPTPMFWVYLKSAAEKIDPKATIRSNIPYVNFAKQYAHLSSPNWCLNIYGTRYPRYREESFRSYNDLRKKLWRS